MIRPLNTAVPFLVACLLSSGRGQIALDELVDLQPDSGEDRGVAVEAPGNRDHGSPGRAVRREDRLDFLDGDSLGGHLLEIDGKRGLLWRHPDAESPIRFATDNLKTVLMREMVPAEELATLPMVELTNGDIYRGRIQSMDPETLVLETPFAGPVTLATPMIASIRPESVSTGVYEGPNSLEEWTASGNDDWTYRDGALFSGKGNDVIGIRLEEFPDSAMISCDVDWKGNLQLYLGFWAKDPEQQGSENYSLMLQSSYLRLYRHSDTHGRHDLGNLHVPQFQQVSGGRLTLYLDRKDQEVLFFFNGELIKSWKDRIDGEIEGDAFSFRATGNSRVRIRNIRVAKWDGELKGAEQEVPEARDLLMLKNGDLYSGTLTRIEQGVFTFENDLATFNVPVDRVGELIFAGGSRQTPRLRAGDVRIHFPDGERITLALTDLREGRLRGASEASGGVAVRVPYIEHLTFNPYDERHEEEEELW